jgi:hypothetical protein
MLLGHYAAGLAAKKFAPKTNLGILVAAGVFLDLIWPFFLLLGVEKVIIDPGNTVVTPLNFVSYPWSHSFLTSAIWGAVFGGIYYGVTRYKTGAIVLGLLVVSHWLLDAPMHRPDLPLTPWSETMIGFSLWNSVALSFLLEFGLLAGGIYLYASGTKPLSRFGKWGLIAFGFLGVFVYVANFFGPPPPSVSAIIVGGSVVQGVFILLAIWTDRSREHYKRS